MSKYAGQRRSAKSRRIPAIGWVAAGIAVGLSAITAIAVLAHPEDGAAGDNPRASDGSEVGDDITPRDSCDEAATIGVPAAYLAAWTQVMTYLQPESDCQPTDVIAVSSAAVALGEAPKMDVWIPEDASWIARAAESAGQGRPSAASPVARTPVVIATTAETDTAVGGIQKLLTPAALGPLARDTKTFADFGSDTAGALRVALPDPGGSAAGALGFAAIVEAATGEPLTAAPAYVNPTRRDLTTIKTEHRVVALGGDEAAVLDDLDPTSKDAANVAVTTEQAALARMQSTPGDELAVGYLGIDLAMAAVAVDTSSQSVVDELTAFVATSAGATALTEAGLRPATGGATPSPVGAVDPAAFANPGATATAEQVGGLTLLFAAMHQRISTLVLLDASGSMLQPLPGSDVSKIDLVRRAARDTLAVASPSARAGLMTFRSDSADRPIITTQVKLAANGERANGMLHSTAIRKAVDGLQVNGGTPLYNAVRDAYRAAVDAYDPTMVNQIALLSDGRNEDAEGSISLRKLLRILRDEADPERPVRIIAIGYGPDADMDALNRIVDTTNGRASWLQSVGGYSDAVQTAVFSA